MPPPRAVVLDLDDTLIVEEQFARQSVRRAGALVPGTDPAKLEATVLAIARRLWFAGPHHPLCLQLGFASWEGLWATFAGGHPSIDGLRSWVPGYRQAVWATVVRELGHGDPALATALAEAYVAEQRSGHPLIDGAASTVHELVGRNGLGGVGPERVRLGLLTNGPPDIQRYKIAGTGLADCFDAIVVSGEIGVGKPDPRAYAAVLDQLEVDPSDAVMVGDSWERDVVGARRIGMRAVWVANRRPSPEPADPDNGLWVVDHIGHLPDVFA